MACSTCGVLPPVREQFSLCDVHSRRLRQVNDVWPLRFVGERLRVFSDTGYLCGPAHSRASAATGQQIGLIMLCLCHVARARVERSGPRVPLCSRCPFLLVFGRCLLVLLVSETLQRRCHSKCRRSAVKSNHHVRLSFAPVAKQHPCLFNGSRGMQTRRTCLYCCFSPGLFVGVCPCALTWFSFLSGALR